MILLQGVPFWIVSILKVRTGLLGKSSYNNSRQSNIKNPKYGGSHENHCV
jgi:hypothetical protein